MGSQNARMEQDLKRVKQLKSQCEMAAGARQAFGSQGHHDDAVAHHCKALGGIWACAILKASLSDLKGVDLAVAKTHCRDWNLREAKLGRSLEEVVLGHVKNLYSKTQQDGVVLATAASVTRTALAIEDGQLNIYALDEK